jgi:hypothetical protein
MQQFIHSGPLGDMIYSLPAMQALGGGRMFTQPRWADFVRPLLLAQPYVEDVAVYEEYPSRMKRRRTNRISHEPLIHHSEKHGTIINLDKWKQHRTKQERDNMYSAALLCDMVNVQPNLEEPWLTGITPNPVAPIVICCTNDYHDKEAVDWSLLTDYAEHIIFHGLPKDYQYFQTRWDIPMKYIKCNTALELAQLIAGSKLFIGNLSGSYAVAEAMKHPRVLEECAAIPALGGPIGPNGSTTLTREMLDACIST